MDEIENENEMFQFLEDTNGEMFYNISFIQTFLCSEAVLGLSGVVFMLAGVAATGEEEDFSIISAGIFFIENIPQNHSKLWSTGVGLWIFSACDIQKSPLASEILRYVSS